MKLYFLPFLSFISVLMGCNNNGVINNPAGFDSKKLAVSKQSLEQTINGSKYEGLHSQNDLDKINTLVTADIGMFCLQSTKDSVLFNNTINNTFSQIANSISSETMLNGLTNLYRVIAFEGGEHQPMMWAEDKARDAFYRYVAGKQLAIIMKQKVELALHYQNNDSVRIANILLADIDQCTLDSTINDADFKQMVQSSLARLDSINLQADEGQDKSLIYLIPDVYYCLSKFLWVDANSQLTAWFNANNTYTPPPYSELEENAKMYLEYIKSLEIVSKAQAETLSKLITDDLKAFQQEEDTTILLNRAEQSLATIENIALDTEDREFICGLYYNMAANKQINLSRLVNKWMYGNEIQNLDDEFNKGRMPWER